jgi:hypothetical protein
MRWMKYGRVLKIFEAYFSKTSESMENPKSPGQHLRKSQFVMR